MELLVVQERVAVEQEKLEQQTVTLVLQILVAAVVAQEIILMELEF
jgi:hypothetical protein